MAGQSLLPKTLQVPGQAQPLKALPVPTPPARPAFLAHPRLRRTSPISQFAVAAALEALGSDATRVADGSLSLGIVLCVMCGCVNYSRRFYDETLKDPATASPLVFPETVFNAPASHLAALLGSRAINYTLVGDPGVFLQGLAVAADWLASGRVEACLVVGAEELDWLTSEAAHLFDHGAVLSEGGAALYLRSDFPVAGTPRLLAITHPKLFFDEGTRLAAAREVRDELGGAGQGEGLWDSRVGLGRPDRAEIAAWLDWVGERTSPKTLLGEGFTAAAGWQCVLAADALTRGQCASAVVSVVGCNEQAIAARFGISGL
jgi:hypothetical protein